MVYGLLWFMASTCASSLPGALLLYYSILFSTIRMDRIPTSTAIHQLRLGDDIASHAEGGHAVLHSDRSRLAVFPFLW